MVLIMVPRNDVDTISVQNFLNMSGWGLASQSTDVKLGSGSTEEAERSDNAVRCTTKEKVLPPVGDVMGFITPTEGTADK